MRARSHSNARARTASFGFREIPEAEKVPLVQGVFTSVAGRYDLMNDLMSGGVHRLWKADMIAWLRPRRGGDYLDLAGGTGDIAFRILNHLEPRNRSSDSIADPEEPGAQVTVCDLTPGMLAVGRDRALDRGLTRGLAWTCGDAEDLPFPDRTFDAVTIAFGLRNVTHIERALAEIARVLRPGGRFLCLEFSKVVLPVLAELYDRYSFAILPRLGELVTGDADSYRYLVESIRRFPAQEDLAGRIEAAGLAQVRVRNLSGGIAALHSAWRI